MPKKETKSYGKPLDTNAMHVTPDAGWILVGGQRYRRTVIPSVDEKMQGAVLEELDEQQHTTNTDTTT